MFWNRRSASGTAEPLENSPGEAGPGLSENLRALLASASGYFRARIELAGVEGKEAAGIYGQIIALLAGAAILSLFGYVLLWIGMIAGISLLWGPHWAWITLVVALLHFIFAAVCLGVAYRKWGQPVFTATLDEFRKDQQWLSRTPSQTNGNHA